MRHPFCDFGATLEDAQETLLVEAITGNFVQRGDGCVSGFAEHQAHFAEAVAGTEGGDGAGFVRHGNGDLRFAAGEDVEVMRFIALPRENFSRGEAGEAQAVGQFAVLAMLTGHSQSQQISSVYRQRVGKERR